jgi:hypothetical protein
VTLNTGQSKPTKKELGVQPSTPGDEAAPIHKKWCRTIAHGVCFY